MIRRTLLVAVWLGAGALLIAALYWIFVNTPESNVLMLTVSAVLTLLTIAAAAVVVTVAVLLAAGGDLKPSLTSGMRRAGWFLVVALPIFTLIWVISVADAWVARRSGEISAWFIARLGWSDITPLFTAQRYVSVWLRWVLLPVVGIAALAALLQTGGDAPPARVRATAHGRTLLIATLAFLILVALPWQAAFWQIPGLPPTWVEPAIAALRLAIIALLMVVGFAIIFVAAARETVSNHVES